MRGRWLLCCGWRSPLCVADTLSHFLGLNLAGLCDRHDAAIVAHFPDSEDDR